MPRTKRTTDDDLIAVDDDFLEEEDEFGFAVPHLARKWLTEDSGAGRAARGLSARDKIERWHEERRLALQNDPFMEFEHPRRRSRRHRNIRRSGRQAQAEA